MSILFCFAISLFIFNPSCIKIFFRIAKRHYIIMLLAISIACLAACITFYLKAELNNYVSPTRGSFSTGGNLPLTQEGAQPRVSASLEGYKILLNRTIEAYGGIHHGFYFGVIPLLLLTMGAFKSKNRLYWPFIATAAFAVLIGLGKSFMLFPLLVKYVPGFKILRHTFGFAHFACFSLICAAGFGLKAFLYENRKTKTVIFIIGVTSAILFFLTKDNISRSFITLSLFTLLISFLLLRRRNNLKAPVLAFSLIFLILLIDLCLFNIKSKLPSKSNQYFNRMIYFVELKPPSAMLYPLERTLLPRYTAPIPFNFFPIYFKEASLTCREENLIFMRNARLHDMLQHAIPGSKDELALGAGFPLVYFTNDVRLFSDNINKNTLIINIFDEFISKQTGAARVFFQKADIDFDKEGFSGQKISTNPILNIKRDNPNRIEMESENPSGGFLVRLENYHKGWRAKVDGKPVKIYRANYAFQAIRVPAGRHRVIFEFKTIYPVLLYIYLLISALAWIALNWFLYTISPGKDAARPKLKPAAV